MDLLVSFSHNDVYCFQNYCKGLNRALLAKDNDIML